MRFDQINKTNLTDSRYRRSLKKRWLRLIVLPLLCVFFTAGYAAVPDAINYQGFLKDSAGTPINATHNITFKVYSAAIGGSALYSDTQSITIVDGQFDTQLGDSPTFPANLFDGTPLFLGLEIDSDGEMSPRQPLSSTPYAYKAEDADTVGGLSAASLDQSAHVGNTDNPHGVTATQVGAASLNDLSSHATSESVHHFRYNNSEAVTAMGAVSNSNSLNHNRFTSSNAVSAMGAKSNANALHHDRFTESDVLAVDGLDADFLDGMNANAIIDAASDEVRTPIFDSDLPLTISAPGSYYFAENLIHESTTSPAILISANHVVINMNGLVLTGPGQGSGTANSGIVFTSQQNVTIKNGTVRQFGGYGVIEGYESSPAIDIGVHRIVNVAALENGYVGISVFGQGSVVRDCIATRNGTTGIEASSLNRVINCTISGNANWGIAAGFGSYIADNTVNGNTVGIYTQNGSIIKDNLVRSNSQWGVYGEFGGSVIEGNSVISNNVSDTPGVGGVYVSQSSNVVNNTVANNKNYGIFVNGGDSLIDSNHVADTPGIGIWFNADGSAYRNNTAAGNTTAFQGSGTSTDLGGNAFY